MDTVISDNGPQFKSADFHTFACDWEFEHSTSSPYHSQSNGKAESAVKIAKKLVKKCVSSKTDIWKAILDWRNTPTKDMNCSPVQRLMSRRTRHSLPTAAALLEQISAQIPMKRSCVRDNFQNSSMTNTLRTFQNYILDKTFE